MALTATVENVGDGTLVSFSNGGSLWFDSRADAALFGSRLAMVAQLGGDTLDGAPVVDTE